MSQSKFALPRNGFTFKQFFVAHDRCAMKVGTDGILLGAWAPIAQVKHVLDIGSGSGLLALMLAQRTDDRVMRSNSMKRPRRRRAKTWQPPRGGRGSRCIWGIFNGGNLRKPDVMN